MLIGWHFSSTADLRCVCMWVYVCVCVCVCVCVSEREREREAGRCSRQPHLWRQKNNSSNKVCFWIEPLFLACIWRCCFPLWKKGAKNSFQWPGNAEIGFRICGKRNKRGEIDVAAVSKVISDGMKNRRWTHPALRWKTYREEVQKKQTPRRKKLKQNTAAEDKLTLRSTPMCLTLSSYLLPI